MVDACAAATEPGSFASSLAQQAGERPDRGDGADKHHEKRPGARSPRQVAPIELLWRPDECDPVADEQRAAEGEHQPRQQIVAEKEPGSGGQHDAPAYSSSRVTRGPPRQLTRRGSRGRGTPQPGRPAYPRRCSSSIPAAAPAPSGGPPGDRRAGREGE